MPREGSAGRAALGGVETTSRWRAGGRTYACVHLPRRGAGGTVVGVTVVAHDLTDLERRAEEAAARAREIQASEARFRSIVTNMRDIVFCHGGGGGLAHGYDADGAALYGADVERLAGTRDERGRARMGDWYGGVHPDDRAAYLAAEHRRKTRHEDYSLDYRIFHPVTGELRWVREVAWVDRDPAQQRISFDSYILDITEQKRAEIALAELRERHRRLLDAAPVAILLWADDRCVYANPMADRLLGVTDPGELESLSAAELFEGDVGAALARELAALCAGSGELPPRELCCRRRDGALVPVEARAVVATEHGRPLVQLVLVDLTERERSETLRHQAQHDTLTGLPNRGLLMERLGQAVAAARRGRSGLALMLLDLDRFKYVNDAHGHAVGDELLRQAAERIRRTIREVDTLARLGGDEFALLQIDARDARAMAQLAGRICEVLAEPFQLGGQEIITSVSIGIAAWPADGTDLDTLLRQADLALYRAKAHGRGRYCFFDASLDAETEARRLLETDLRRAVARQELHLVYQPQLDLATRRVVGAEALLRWSCPTRGPVTPAEIIPVAEATGIIESLGAWVLDQACAQARIWGDQGLPLRMAVNVSARQLRGSEFAQMVATTLRRHGLPPHRLCLELSEHLIVGEQFDEVGAALGHVLGEGVQLAIDDFGMGASSLLNLKRLPAQHLKIDRRLIGAVGADDDSEAIVKASIGLAHGLGKRVLAEGVETEAQHGFLAALGCDQGQGFAYARPAAAESLRPYLAAHH